MKNTCALAISALLLSSNAQAQTGLEISIKGGPQRTDMQCSMFKTDNRTGYTGGIGAAFGITRHLAIGLDALYSSEGRRIILTSSSQPDGIDFRERIGYLKTPLYLAYTLRPGKTISFTARLGPQLSFLLHGETLDRTNRTVLHRGTRALYNRVNVGAMAGFDVNARLSPAVSLSLGLRADMTFTDTERASIYWAPLDASYTINRNATALLSVHYNVSRVVNKPRATPGA